VVAHGWQAWRTEIPWMSLYFTVTVWASIALMNLPRLHGTHAGVIARAVANPGSAAVGRPQTLATRAATRLPA
jgi:hypothetical protein